MSLGFRVLGLGFTEALRITYTIVGVPYSNCRQSNIPPGPVLIIRAPIYYCPCLDSRSALNSSIWHFGAAEFDFLIQVPQKVGFFSFFGGYGKYPEP